MVFSLSYYLVFCILTRYCLLDSFALDFLILSAYYTDTFFVGLFCSIDKTLANGLGPKSGYTLKEPTLPNVVDIVLVYCQQVCVTFFLIIFIALLLMIPYKLSCHIWCFLFQTYNL